MTKAQLLCLECPVRLSCLGDHLREKWGIWGGLGPVERRRIVDAVRKGRTIPDVLIRVDKKIRARAAELKVKDPNENRMRADVRSH